MQATLQAEGERPEDLLAWVQAARPQRHSHAGQGYRLANSGRIATAHAAPSPEAGNAGFQITNAVLQTDALTLLSGAS